MTVSEWTPILIALLTPIATLAIVMVGFLYSNRRIDDVGLRIGDMRADMEQRFADLRTDMDHRLNDLRDALRAEMAKNHSEMLARFADLDTRLTRLESRLGG